MSNKTNFKDDAIKAKAKEDTIKLTGTVPEGYHKALSHDTVVSSLLGVTRYIRIGKQ